MTEQLGLFSDIDTGDAVKRLQARRQGTPGPPPAAQAANDKAAILAELQRGPTTADKLQELAMGYRQRISDLRKDGHKIECRKLTGRLSLYTLKGADG